MQPLDRDNAQFRRDVVNEELEAPARLAVIFAV